MGLSDVGEDVLDELADVGTRCVNSSDKLRMRLSVC